MPFDLRFPQQLPFPAWTAEPPVTDTGRTTPGPATIQLDTLPCEILLRIAACLDGPSVRRLSETSRQIHAGLDHDMLATMRLADRIRWVVTASGFAAMAHQILQRPATQRAALTLQLAERRLHLHPSLWAGAERALGTLVPQDDGERLSLALHMESWRLAQRQNARNSLPEALPALQHVLDLPAQDRGPVLAQWIAVARKNGVAQRAPAQWQAIVSALPEAARALVLSKLVKHASISDPQAWEQMARNAIDAARNLTPPGNPARVRIFRAIAKACHVDFNQPPGVHTEWRSRRAVWEAVLDLVETVSAPQRRTLLAGLATYASLELSQMGELTVQTHGTDIPAWSKLLEKTASVLRDTDAIAEVLAAMAKDPDPWAPFALAARVPMLAALMAGARRLPDPQCGKVLAMALHRPSPDAGIADSRYTALWDAVFIASAQTDANCQAPLLAKLAGTLANATHHARAVDQYGPASLPSRWLALLDRTMALPESLRLAPARALLDACERLPQSMGYHQKLLRLALSLPKEADRAELLAALVDLPKAMQPCDWRDIVNQIGSLSGATREAPAKALVRRLAIMYDQVFPHVDRLPAARQSDLPLAAWPQNHHDALRQASVALQWLPHKAIAATLANLVPDGSWYRWWPAAMAWLLEEARRLPPDARDEAAIVTGICNAMARLCDEDDEDDVLAFLPDVLNAVLALPLHSRGSALAWLADVVEELDIEDPWADRIREQRQALPDEDRPTPNILKRKEPPA